MKLVTQHTKKLLYGKYLYKASLFVPGVSWLRYSKEKNIDSLCTCESYEEFIAKNVPAYGTSFWPSSDNGLVIRNRKIWNSRFLLYKIATMIQDIKVKHDITIRLQDDTIGFYLNSKDVWENICRRFKDNVSELSWPEDTNVFSLTNGIELVKRYPHNKFKYKINLKSGIVSNDVKQNFQSWIEQYPEFKVSDKTLESLKRVYLDGNGKFLYSTNLKNVLLLQMFLGELIGKTTTYKLESKANGK